MCLSENSNPYPCAAAGGAVGAAAMRILLTAVVLTFLHAGALAGQTANCVDINTAAPAQLQRIIHIGPARAAEIVQLREGRRFESVDQLTRVRGIAAVRLRDIKAQGLACVRPAKTGHADERQGLDRPHRLALSR
jgi:hypothetical protein